MEKQQYKNLKKESRNPLRRPEKFNLTQENPNLMFLKSRLEISCELSNSDSRTEQKFALTVYEASHCNEISQHKTSAKFSAFSVTKVNYRDK